MTFAELDRLTKSKQRMMKLEAKEKASHNYVLALLVGKAVASRFDSNTTYPEIHEVYPHLFTVDKTQEDIRQERMDELSALRFKHFAKSFNTKFNNGGQKA